jgi:hypothetical protein
MYTLPAGEKIGGNCLLNFSKRRLEGEGRELSKLYFNG